MKHTHHATRSLAIATVALTLSLQVAAAQTDPLADLFGQPALTQQQAEATPIADNAAASEPMHAAASADFLADVTGLFVTDATTDSITLSWQAVAGADNYTVYYGATPIADTSDGLYAYDDLVGNVTSYTLTQLQPNTAYYIAVTAENMETLIGSEFYSAELSARTLATTTTATTDITDTETAAVAVDSEDAADTYAAAGELPQSGPLAGVLLAGAALGAAAIRRFMKKI